jgi:uncharacterized protein GlcG (DUF336 family)
MWKSKSGVPFRRSQVNVIGVRGLPDNAGKKRRSLMTTLTLKQAEKIIDAILKRARQKKCRPMSVVVVEPGAIVKAFKKEDGSAMMRFEMAMGKAYAALALGRSSSLVRLRTEEKPLFMDFLFKASHDKIFAEGGGLLIRGKDGELLGAVGVTGDKEMKDEELAAHGIRAAGLKTDEDCAGSAHHVRLAN